MRAALLGLAACSPTAEPARPAPVPVALTSPDIDADGRLSADCGCGPGSRSPALAWGELPPGTVSLAVLVHSAGPAGEATHWTAWDLDPAAGALPPGIRPTAAPPLQGVTANGRVGWTPVCGLPPEARVRIELAALDTEVLPPPTIGAVALRTRLAPHLLGLGRLEATPPAAPVPEAP